METRGLKTQSSRWVSVERPTSPICYLLHLTVNVASVVVVHCGNLLSVNLRTFLVQCWKAVELSSFFIVVLQGC